MINDINNMAYETHSKINCNTPLDVNKYIEEPWSVIESYFRGKHLQQLVRHQIESYNDFVTYQIQKTIVMFNPVIIHSEQDYDASSDKYKLELQITFNNFSIHRPQIHENNGATKLMFPSEARLRNFTYTAGMTIDINIKYIIRSGANLETEQVLLKTLPKIHMGKLPIMLKSAICVLSQYKHVDPRVSGECYMDAGGYFIINGSEKTCLAQERAAENSIQCFHSVKNTKWSYTAEIKSVPDSKCISPKQIVMYISTKNNGFGTGIYIQIPRIKNPIPLFIVFRAIGLITDQEICECIVLDTNNKDNEPILLTLRGSIVDANKYLTQDAAIDYITNHAMYTPLNMDKETGAKKKKEFTMQILERDIFPHCNTKINKEMFLGYMTNRLIRCSLGWDKPSDRDSYLNKRIDLTGMLLNNLFRNYFNKLVKDMQKQIIREINHGSWRSTEDYLNIVNMTNIYKVLKSTTIENGIKRALSTGDFAIMHSNGNKAGVAQVLNRLTYISALSHLRRVNTPIDKSGKLIAPRKLAASCWGFLCLAETPEGASVGVVKNLSYMTHVTIPCESNGLYDFVTPHIHEFDKISKEELSTGVKVFVNGTWIGIAKNPIELYSSLKQKKYKGIINVYTSIIFDTQRKEIRVCNDAGRLTRPVFRVKNAELLINNSHISALNKKEQCWNDLLTDFRNDDAVIEYIDPAEQNYSMIAMAPNKLKTGYKQSSSQTGLDINNYIYKYTHCEIHPSTIFGILASCIPFPEHNQSPRNTYQCAMGKQAMGMYVTNYDKRMDKTAYVLTYPMRPLVDTRIMNLIKLNEIPSGSQVIVAIMTHSGYNQEDSILFNKSSIDRGLFQATIYHTEKDEGKNSHGDEEIRRKPDKTKTKGMKLGNYDKVNCNGVIPENTLVENRDIIIAKMVAIKNARNNHTEVIKYKDQSKICRTKEEIYVDKNVIGKNGDGYTLCKVRLRAIRKPVIGDKFSSRHGQKGTIGNIIPECDMPFTESGVKPDIIINPHAIPSRMTIAQLKETLLGKVLLEMGLFGDGTSFGDFEIKDICKKLREVGYESTGNELLYNGLTGEQIETSIFMGPVFYQRLKHMVSDKYHSRATGPMVNLTHQPAEGRARDGGLRYGEMERDCMCSHGASRFNKGRLYDASDAFSVHVCKRCGMIAAYNDKYHIHHCKMCDNRSDFNYVELPYACKLMFQELMTMNVAPRMLT